MDQLGGVLMPPQLYEFGLDTNFPWAPPNTGADAPLAELAESAPPPTVSTSPFGLVYP